MHSSALRWNTKSGTPLGNFILHGPRGCSKRSSTLDITYDTYERPLSLKSPNADAHNCKGRGISAQHSNVQKGSTPRHRTSNSQSFVYVQPLGRLLRDSGCIHRVRRESWGLTMGCKSYEADHCQNIPFDPGEFDQKHRLGE